MIPSFFQKKNAAETTIYFFSKLCLIASSYLLIHFIYLGIISPITPGDSTGYHIPIAKSIIDGGVFRPHYYFADNPTGFYPGSSEAILSLMIILGVPLNLFNILGNVLLFLALWYLGVVIKLSKYMSIIFSTSIITLPLLSRWVITQFVDYWFATYYVLLIALFLKPRNSIFYFVLLGIVSGLLIGTKYSGPFTLGILILFFFRSCRQYLSVTRIGMYFLFTFVFGGVWYIRNLLITGNAFFPQNIFRIDEDYLRFKVFDAIITNPLQMFNAFISEYLAWSVVIIFLPILLIYFYFKRKNMLRWEEISLAGIGTLSFVLFIFLPSEPGSYTHYISTFRYSLTISIPFILLAFLIAEKTRNELLLLIVTFLSIISVPPLGYHPKLIFFLIPFIVIIVYPDLIKNKLTLTLSEDRKQKNKR